MLGKVGEIRQWRNNEGRIFVNGELCRLSVMPPYYQMAEAFKSRLSECLEKGDDGQLKMTITLPDESALDTLSKSLAQILSMSP